MHMPSDSVDLTVKYVGYGLVEKLPISQPSKVRLRCTSPASLYKTRGPVTGNLYEFKGGGIASVDPRDAPELLKKTMLTGCCGSPRVAKNIFELMG